MDGGDEILISWDYVDSWERKMVFWVYIILLYQLVNQNVDRSFFEARKVCEQLYRSLDRCLFREGLMCRDLILWLGGGDRGTDVS